MKKYRVELTPQSIKPCQNFLYGNLDQLPSLHYGLDKVFQKRGPHFLELKSSKAARQYNFDAGVQNIPQLENLNLNNLKPFVRAVDDLTLFKFSKESRSKFNSSTSSITGLVSQLYQLILNDKKLHKVKDIFSPEAFDAFKKYAEFSPFLVSGTLFNLIHNDGVYTVDAVSNGYSSDLMTYGHILESFLTSTPEEFKKALVYKETWNHPEEIYNFSKYNDILIRSQLDAQDPSLPKRTFDLKTRAVLGLRLDVATYKENTWYKITKKRGQFNSFEREYFDMMRTAFKKYSLQVRMGGMDGIFVAFHNTIQHFGFQYISLEEMDSSIFHSHQMADQTYSLSLQILNHLLNHITDHFPNQTMNILASPPTVNGMIFFVHPNRPTRGQKPLQVKVVAKSLVNGVHMLKPIVGTGDVWKVEFDIQDMEFDQDLHLSKEKRVNFFNTFTPRPGMKSGTLEMLKKQNEHDMMLNKNRK